MFDWVLNTPLNIIKNFFRYFQIKINDFFNFFSTISFSTNTCQRLRCIQNPVENSTMELEKYCEIYFFLQNSQETPVLESHFNKVTGLYPATSLKERTPTQVFSDEFCEILKAPFLQNTSRRLLLFYGKNILSIKQ